MILISLIERILTVTGNRSNKEIDDKKYNSLEYRNGNRKGSHYPWGYDRAFKKGHPLSLTPVAEIQILLKRLKLLVTSAVCQLCTTGGTRC